jgi:DNA-binding NtrC family response regulator
MADTRLHVPFSESDTTKLCGVTTILVVDDESCVRNFCTSVLTSAGYEVLSAEDGFAALSICRAARSPVHLALLDVRMPKMNGPELLVKLLDCLVPLNLAIRFILMSGQADPKAPDPANRNQRSYPFLRKPFTSSALLEAVRHELDVCTAPGKGQHWEQRECNTSEG